MLGTYHRAGRSFYYGNPISEWTPWDKNDCRYLYIFKNWETEGFAKESAKSHECLMQEPEPPRITIKHIWEIN